MPTVTVSEEDRRYLEKLRKKIPLEKVPSIKYTVELVLGFIEKREADFMKWMEQKKGEEH